MNRILKYFTDKLKLRNLLAQPEDVNFYAWLEVDVWLLQHQVNEVKRFYAWVDKLYADEAQE